MKFFYKEKMTTSEKSIAAYIETNTGSFLDHTISELANKCFVSTSMITKFSKSMGFTSYRNMQIEISNEFGNYKINRINGDGDITIIAKTIGSFVKYGVDNIISQIDQDTLVIIAALLNNSKQIFALGNGSSKYAAENTVSRLRVLGKNAVLASSETDITLWGNKDDWEKTIAIIYSYSGTGILINRVITFLEKNNIFYIIITTNKSLEQKNRNLIVNFHALEEDEKEILSIFSPKISTIVISDIIIEVMHKLYNIKKKKIFKL